MPIVAYGKTFQNEKDKNSYAQMKRESRSRTLARAKSMTLEQKQDAQTRSHFRGESKRLGDKYGIKL